MKALLSLAAASVAIVLLRGIARAEEESASNQPPARPAAADSGDAYAKGVEKKVARLVQNFADAYGAGDADGVARLWSDGGAYVEPNAGEEFVGRAEIRRYFEDRFADRDEAAKVTVKASDHERVSPEVVIERGELAIAAGADSTKSTYAAVAVRHDGTWLLDRLSLTSAGDPYPSHHQFLHDLEWMIGSWVGKSSGAAINVTCEWAGGGNFLKRTISADVAGRIDANGTQFIGWDPKTKQIHSWAFEAGGGYGEGVWTRSEEQPERWEIHASGTLPDGSKSQATNVVTKIDDDSYTWKSVDREVEGEILPDVEEILIVRKAEASQPLKVRRKDGVENEEGSAGGSKDDADG